MKQVIFEKSSPRIYVIIFDRCTNNLCICRKDKECLLAGTYIVKIPWNILALPV